MRKYMIILAISCLSACGGSSSGSGGSVDRGAEDPPVIPPSVNSYINSDEAMQVCRDARKEFLAGGSEDENQYISRLEALANKSEPCAQYGLGLLYVTGFERAGVAADTEKAKVWLQKAVDQKHTLSIKLLAELNNK